MLPASASFKTTAKSYAKTTVAYLSVAHDNGTATLNASMIRDAVVTRSLCVSGTFTLGSTVAGSCQVTALTSALSGITLEGAAITPFFGYVLNGTPTYIKQPTYYVDGSTVKNQGLFTSFTAYDSFMEPWMEEPVDLDFAFDASLSPANNIAALASIYTGLTWSYADVPTTGTTPVQIDSSMTVREVIGRIAIAAGCNVMMEPDLTIAFRYPHTSSDETLTNANYKQCVIDGSDTTFVTYIQAGDRDNVNQYPDDSLISGNTVRNTGLNLDSSYLTDNDTATLQLVFGRFATMTVPAIHSVNYFGYQGHQVDVMGLPYLEPGDLITITDTRGDTYKICPLTVKHGFNGGLKTTLSATTISKDSTAQSTVAMSISVASSSVKSQIAAVQNQITAIYGTCHTGSGVAAKVVSDMPDFALYTGVSVTVYFEYPNAVANPTLNVNGTGAYPIFANQAALGYPSAYDWKATQYVGFVFAGGAWHIIGANPANFCGFVSDGNGGRVLQVSSDANASGAHTDIGSDYIALMHGNTTQLKIESDTITLGNSPNRMVLASTGVSIEGGSSTVNISSSALVLQQGSNESSKTTLTASQLETPIVQHTQTKFVNTDAPSYTYVMEHRSNGHLSWKAIEN